MESINIVAPRAPRDLAIVLTSMPSKLLIALAMVFIEMANVSIMMPDFTSFVIPLFKDFIATIMMAVDAPMPKRPLAIMWKSREPMSFKAEPRILIAAANTISIMDVLAMPLVPLISFETATRTPDRAPMATTPLNIWPQPISPKTVIASASIRMAAANITIALAILPNCCTSTMSFAMRFAPLKSLSRAMMKPSAIPPNTVMPPASIPKEEASLSRGILLRSLSDTARTAMAAAIFRRIFALIDIVKAEIESLVLSRTLVMFSGIDLKEATIS